MVSNLGYSQNIFVDPGGNDSGNGTKKNPCATIQRALVEISKARNDGRMQQVTINLREGIYPIHHTLKLDGKFSNINIQAYQKEKVIFFGGVHIPLNKIEAISASEINSNSDKKVYEVNLKKLGLIDYGKIRNVGFARPYGPSWGEIFINSKPMHLARWPNEEMIPMGKVLDKGSIPRDGDYSNHGGVIQYDSLRINTWVKEKDAWMSGYFMWGYADDMVKIKSIDTTNKTISTASATLYGFASGESWRRWYGENILSELDTVGEYYIDRVKGILYFIPPDKKIESLEFSILKDPFFLLTNTSDVNIKGITFECARGLGIAMENTNDITIQGCSFRNLGSLAITVGKGIEPFKDYRHEGTGIAKDGIVGSLQQHLYANTTFNREGGNNNKIISCQFYELGAGGIVLGGGNRLTLEVGNNVVENCVFHDLNRIEKSYRPAILLTGVGNKIRHCEIYNTPSMAILMHGNNHLLEYNYIHDVCTEAEDQGAFYFGRDPSERGTMIRYNYFENIPDDFSTCAIYEDDGACGLTVTGNIFYKAGKRNVLIGGGSDNAYTNNIFIGNKAGFHVDNRLQNWAKGLLAADGLYRKRLEAVNYLHPPYSAQYPQLKSYFDSAAFPHRNLLKNNVFIQVGKIIEGNEEWLNFKLNNWETDQDPGFAGWKNRNFSLKKHSIIFEKIPSFNEIPFQKIGLYENPDIPTNKKMNGLRGEK
ncbi:MAG: right-handed parallel beta-helix repeat-containing protein [Ginsengibacter sp.]